MQVSTQDGEHRGTVNVSKMPVSHPITIKSEAEKERSWEELPHLRVLAA